MSDGGLLETSPTWTLDDDTGPKLPKFLQGNALSVQVGKLFCPNLEEFGANTMASQGRIVNVNAPMSKEFNDHAFKHSSVYVCDAPNTTAVYKEAFCASSIKKVQFPLCKTVDEGAFLACLSLTCATLSDKVCIGLNAFCRCSNLKEVRGELKRVGDGAFCGCSKLEYVNLSCCTHIGKSAFARTTKLRDVVFSRKLTFIGEWAFDRSGVRYLYIDAEFCRILYGAFQESRVVYAFLNVLSVEGYIFEKCKHLFWADIHTESLPGSSILGCEKLHLLKTSALTISGVFGLNCDNLRCLHTFAPYFIEKLATEENKYPDPRKCVIHNISSKPYDRHWFVIDPEVQRKRNIQLGYIKCKSSYLPMISAIRSEFDRFFICFILSVKKFQWQHLFKNVPKEMIYFILAMLPWNACLGKFLNKT